jgi:hypothetical protein
VLSAAILASNRTTQAIFCGPVSYDAYPTSAMLSAADRFTTANSSRLSKNEGPADELTVEAATMLDESVTAKYGIPDRMSGGNSDLAHVRVWCPTKAAVVASGAINPNSGNLVNTWPISVKSKTSGGANSAPRAFHVAVRPNLHSLVRNVVQDTLIPKWIKQTPTSKQRTETISW